MSYYFSEMPAVAAILIPLFRCQARFPAFETVFIFYDSKGKYKEPPKFNSLLLYGLTRTFFCSLEPFD